MELGRLFRRGLFAAILLGGGGVAAANPDAIRSFYLDLYPSDPGKRQALEMCFLQDHKFNRLDAGERDACYHHMLMPTQAAEGAPTPDRAEPNVLDLRRDAALGSLPRNDIRRIEQNENATRSP